MKNLFNVFVRCLQVCLVLCIAYNSDFTPSDVVFGLFLSFAGVLFVEVLYIVYGSGGWGNGRDPYA